MSDKLPFIPNDEQRILIEVITGKRPHGDVFTVHGVAGTGKTTAVQHGTNGLDPETRHCTVTPTNKACGVLRDKGVRNASTLHKVFLIPAYAAWNIAQRASNVYPDWRHYVRNGFMPKHRFYTDWAPDFTICIVDEMSMVEAIQLDWVVEAMRLVNGLTIPVGDRHQLHPVNGWPSVEKYKPNLTLIVEQRHLDAPYIADLARCIRDPQTNVMRALQSWRRRPRPVDRRLDSRTIEQKFDDGDAVKLALKNIDCRAANETTRALLGRRPGVPVAAHDGFKGDIITLRETSGGELYNGRSWRILSEPRKLLFNIASHGEEGLMTEYDMPGFLATVRAMDDQDVETCIAFNLDVKKRIKADEQEDESENEENNLLRMSERIWTVTDAHDDGINVPVVGSAYYVHAEFGFASTVHRAQGSEWDTVYFKDRGDLHGMLFRELTKWLSVATYLEIKIIADGSGVTGLRDIALSNGALDLPPPWVIKGKVRSNEQWRLPDEKNAAARSKAQAQLTRAALWRCEKTVINHFHWQMREWAADAQRRLVYTAITRAKRNLFIK